MLKSSKNFRRLRRSDLKVILSRESHRLRGLRIKLQYKTFLFKKTLLSRGMSVNYFRLFKNFVEDMGLKLSTKGSRRFMIKPTREWTKRFYLHDLKLYQLLTSTFCPKIFRSPIISLKGENPNKKRSRC